MVSPITVGVLIVSIIVVFVLFLIIGVELNSEPNAGVTLINNDFLGSCATNTCAVPYVCDGTSYICKLPVGAPCTSAGECVAGSFCSGLCVTGLTGQLNQYCPCNPVNVCTPQSDGSNVCKGRGGVPCTANSDCASGFCVSTASADTAASGLCAAGSPNAYPCRVNGDCASGNCSSGFCQAPGFVSGQAGSACAGTCVGYSGAACISTPLAPLQCSCRNGANVPGTCVVPDRGLFSACGVISECADQYMCYNGRGVACGEVDMNCLCLFPYPDPEVPPPGKSCIEGMISVAGSCFNSIGQGCDALTICGQGACQGPSVLSVYRFTPNNTTVFVGALDTAVFTLPGPAGLIQPRKMFGFANGAVDSIFVVDNLQGLLLATYDTANNKISTWSTLIPHVQDLGSGRTLTLIDAAYNGQSFVVVYQETRTSGVSVQQASVVYSGPTIDNLTPFNVQTGPGFDGTQYFNGTPIVIDYIDISASNSISLGGDVIVTSQGTYYRKLAGDTTYTIPNIIGGPRAGTPVTGTTGPPRFYFDVIENPSGATPFDCQVTPGNQIMCSSADNFGLVGPFPLVNRTVSQVVQFSGNVAGAATPVDQLGTLDYRVFDYSISSVPPQGMIEGAIITLAQVTQFNNVTETVVTLSTGGNTVIAPYRVSTLSRSLATPNRFYVISLASCIAQ